MFREDYGSLEYCMRSRSKGDKMEEGEGEWCKVRWLFLAQCLTKTGKRNWTPSCFNEKGVAILARY